MINKNVVFCFFRTKDQGEPDFELTKPSIGQDYIEQRNEPKEKKKQQEDTWRCV